MSDLEVGSVRPMCCLNCLPWQWNFRQVLVAIRKGRQRYELCLALLKGIDPSNQSINLNWLKLIDWSRSIWGRNMKRFIKQRQCAYSCPKISIMCCKFGSKLKPFELLCCAQVKTFSIYNFCDLLVIVNWPFPKSHLFETLNCQKFKKP